MALVSGSQASAYCFVYNTSLKTALSRGYGVSTPTRWFQEQALDMVNTLYLLTHLPTPTGEPVYVRRDTIGCVYNACVPAGFIRVITICVPSRNADLCLGIKLH